MLIGLITPATIMANSTNDQKTKLYMINASIIVAGIMTIVQSTGIKHPKIPFQWGAGTLSVMGVSFTTVPVAQQAVPMLMSQYPPYVAKQCSFNYDYFTAASHGPKGFQTGSLAGGSPCAKAAVGTFPFGTFPGAPSCIPNCQSEAFDYAWGKLLGTLAFTALVPMFVSGLSYKRIKGLFPPIVIGPVIMLIGIALIGVGFGDWGGGTFCAQRVIYNGFSNNLFSAVVTNDGDYGFQSTDGISLRKQHDDTHTVTIPFSAVTGSAGLLLNATGGYTSSNATISLEISNLAADNPAARGTTTLGAATTYAKSGTGLQFVNFACGGSGNVEDVYGASEYVGLGFLTFVTIMSVEVFGSPFMRNCSCVIGLLWSYAAATWSRHRGEQYVTQDLMKSSPGITFLWTLRN